MTAPSRWARATTVRGVRHNTTTREDMAASWILDGGVIKVLDLSVAGHTSEIGGVDLGIVMDTHPHAGGLWWAIRAEYDDHRAVYQQAAAVSA